MDRKRIRENFNSNYVKKHTKLEFSSVNRDMSNPMPQDKRETKWGLSMLLPEIMLLYSYKAGLLKGGGGHGGQEAQCLTVHFITVKLATTMQLINPPFLTHRSWSENVLLCTFFKDLKVLLHTLLHGAIK